MFLLFSISAWAVECPAPIPAAMFRKKLDDVEEAIEQRDGYLLKGRMEKVENILPCVVQPLSSELAGEYHLLKGIDLWIHRNQEMAQLYFSAARALGDHDELLQKYYPPGHQLVQDYIEALDLAEFKKVEPPAEGFLYFDGRENNKRPVYRPTIFQYYVDDHLLTFVLEPQDPIPSYLTKAQKEDQEFERERSQQTEPQVLESSSNGFVPTPVGQQMPVNVVERTMSTKRSKMLLVGASVATAATIGFGIGSYQSYQQWKTVSSLEQARVLQQKTNQQGMLTIASAAIGVGLGAWWTFEIR
ncbi:MAG: hypothetical protein CMK59_02580 [Proteobacteria bacterium]|nr:hypothetical protein [Pseudomonadota bacterium]